MYSVFKTHAYKQLDIYGLAPKLGWDIFFQLKMRETFYGCIFSDCSMHNKK